MGHQYIHWTKTLGGKWKDDDADDDDDDDDYDDDDDNCLYKTFMLKDVNWKYGSLNTEDWGIDDHDDHDDGCGSVDNGDDDVDDHDHDHDHDPNDDDDGDNGGDGYMLKVGSLLLRKWCSPQ